MKESFLHKLYLPKSIKELFLGILFFNLFWFILAWVVDNQILPNPIKVYQILPKTLKGDMCNHILASSSRIFLGLLISLLLGFLLGLLIALNKKANYFLQPFLYLSYPIPKLALLPIVMLTFGIGETTKIVMIVLIIVFQIIISIRDAVRSISKENFYVFSSLGASSLQMIRHIVLPAVLPEILSALRVSVGIATSVLFVTETFGTDKGLGFYIVDAWMRIDYLTMYAGIVMISIIGFILFLSIDLFDNLFCKWNKIKTIYK